MTFCAEPPEDWLLQIIRSEFVTSTFQQEIEGISLTCGVIDGILANELFAEVLVLIPSEYDIVRFEIISRGDPITIVSDNGNAQISKGMCDGELTSLGFPSRHRLRYRGVDCTVRE